MHCAKTTDKYFLLHLPTHNNKHFTLALKTTSNGCVYGEYVRMRLGREGQGMRCQWCLECHPQMPFTSKTIKESILIMSPSGRGVPLSCFTLIAGTLFPRIFCPDPIRTEEGGIYLRFMETRPSVESPICEEQSTSRLFLAMSLEFRSSSGYSLLWPLSRPL